MAQNVIIPCFFLIIVKKEKVKRTMMRRIAALLLSLILCTGAMAPERIYAALEEENKKTEETGEEDSTKNQDVQIKAPSAILMEASTGQIIHEVNSDEKMPPASVTKIMTMLLIFDALDTGKIKLEDEVTVSDYAASMGGSQVFLEPGETQTVDTMLKCIAVASANDACVAFKNRRHIKNPLSDIYFRHLNKSIYLCICECIGLF